MWGPWLTAQGVDLTFKFPQTLDRIEIKDLCDWGSGSDICVAWYQWTFSEVLLSPCIDGSELSWQYKLLFNLVTDCCISFDLVSVNSWMRVWVYVTHIFMRINEDLSISVPVKVCMLFRSKCDLTNWHAGWEILIIVYFCWDMTHRCLMRCWISRHWFVAFVECNVSAPCSDIALRQYYKNSCAGKEMDKCVWCEVGRLIFALLSQSCSASTVCHLWSEIK